MEDFCLSKSKELNFKIIHIGSLKDKEMDSKKYHFVTLDLRGKTTVTDLFNLVGRENVKAYIGFDGFIMHLFFINFKKTYVKIRGKINKKSKEEILKYVNPPFKNKKIEIEYIE